VYLDLGSDKGTKLAEVCTNFAPRVGVLFMTKQGAFLQYKASVEPTLTATNELQKRKMMARLLTSQLDAVLSKVDREIEASLKELLAILDKTNYFIYGFLTSGEPETAGNPRVKTLVSELRKEIEKWLHKHV